jgi:hypothetical protein
MGRHSALQKPSALRHSTVSQFRGLVSRQSTRSARITRVLCPDSSEVMTEDAEFALGF